MRQRLTKLLRREEWAIVALAVIVDTAVALWVQRLGLTTALTDQAAHLNFARFVFDSLTPGVSQIGFWPPLLHILMAPLTAIPYLYSTGLAGFVATLPFVVLGAICANRLVWRLGGNRTLGVMAALLWILSPYFMYYAGTPMMEALFISNLIATAYVTLRWLQTNELRYLVWSGVFVALTSLSRWEGIALIVVVSAIALIHLRQTRRTRSELEATAILLVMVASIGAAFAVIYGLVFGKDPLAFTGRKWIQDPEWSLALAEGSVLRTLEYLTHAMYALFSRPLVWLGAISAIVTVAFTQSKRWYVLATFAILLTPLAMVALSVFGGNTSINVVDLHPFQAFHNDRHTLSFLTIIAVAPPLALAALRNRFGGTRLTKVVRAGLAVATTVIVLGAGVQFVRVVVGDRFAIIPRNLNSPTPTIKQTAAYLKENYDYGHVLLTRSGNDTVLLEAGIPLREYIYEANDLYFEQVMNEPWMFARWVVINNSDISTDANNALRNEQNELESRYKSNNEFYRYYSVVFQSDKRIVYKLNEEEVLKLALNRNFDPHRVPSLVDSKTSWQPATVYADATWSAKMDVPYTLREDRLSLKMELLKLYQDQLRPEYQDGFIVDSANRGNSESQSYAMLQAYEMNDIDTFDTVWTWTKKNLQREDGLLSWQFRLDPGYIITITDENAATDADTDIAKALLLGAERWGKVEYKTDAMKIVNGIWDHETAVENGRRHVVAGNWAGEGDQLVLNPSYFDPAAYRIFAKFDTEHDWNSVITQSYADLNAISEHEYANRQWAFLPPNWATVSVADGSYGAYALKPDSVDYSYDAFRTLWRVAMDAQINNSIEAKNYLARVTVFEDEWKKTRSVCSIYFFSKEGTPCEQNTGTMAGAIGAASVTNPEFARQILNQYYLNGNKLNTSKDVPYYEKSWYWFALYGWADKNLQF